MTNKSVVNLKIKGRKWKQCISCDYKYKTLIGIDNGKCTKCNSHNSTHSITIKIDGDSDVWD